MEPSETRMDGIRRVFGFGGPGQKKRRGKKGDFDKELEREKQGEPEEKTMEQGADGGPPRHVFDDPRRSKKPKRRPSDDGKGLKVDLLA